MSITTTISSGTALSAQLIIRANAIIGMQLDADWTGTTITFNASADGVTWGPLYDSVMNEVTVQLPSTFIPNMVVMFGSTLTFALSKVKYLQVRTGTNASPITQAASRTLDIITAGSI